MRASMRTWRGCGGPFPPLPGTGPLSMVPPMPSPPSPRRLPAARRCVADACLAVLDACTGTRRGLPGIIVAGGMRCGTTSLFDWLKDHPQVSASRRKEVHYFDLQLAKGTGWYRRQFAPLRRLPDGTDSRPLESSPYYIFHPAVPARVRAVVPDARVVFLLRDPVERAVSHFRKNVRDGREPLPFAAALAAEEERLAGTEERLLADPRGTSPAHQYFSYKARGCYADQLLRWRAHFPEEQLRAVDAGRLFAEPAAVLAELLAFLGLDAWQPPAFGVRNASRTEAPSDPASIRALEAHFEPHQRRLRDLVGWCPRRETAARAA